MCSEGSPILYKNWPLLTVRRVRWGCNLSRAGRFHDLNKGKPRRKESFPSRIRDSTRCTSLSKSDFKRTARWQEVRVLTVQVLYGVGIERSRSPKIVPLSIKSFKTSKVFVSYDLSCLISLRISCLFSWYLSKATFVRLPWSSSSVWEDSSLTCSYTFNLLLKVFPRSDKSSDFLVI